MNNPNLFALLETTPIEEHPTEQLDSLQAKSLMAATNTGWGNPLSGRAVATAPLSLLAQESDLDVFCDVDCLDSFDDTLPLEIDSGSAYASAFHNCMPSEAPNGEDYFLSQLWPQGLNMSLQSVTSKMNPNPNALQQQQYQPQRQRQQHQQFQMQNHPSSATPSTKDPSMTLVVETQKDTDLENNSAFKPGMMCFISDSIQLPDKKTRVPNISDSQSCRWMERYNELVNICEQHGHCCIPSYWPANNRLAQWVKRQRYQYKLWNGQRQDRPSTLTQERIKLLEDIGFVWDSHAAFWEERLNELKKFKDENGHANVPTQYNKNPQLGIWCKCRKYSAQGSLNVIFSRVISPANQHLYSCFCRTSSIQNLLYRGSSKVVFDTRPNCQTHGHWL